MPILSSVLVALANLEWKNAMNETIEAPQRNGNLFY